MCRTTTRKEFSDYHRRFRGPWAPSPQIASASVGRRVDGAAQVKAAAAITLNSIITNPGLGAPVELTVAPQCVAQDGQSQKAALSAWEDRKRHV